MKAREMVDRLMQLEGETIERICTDVPIYACESGRKLIPLIIADGVSRRDDTDQIYLHIFLAGWYAAKVSQKIELEDLMINGGEV